MAADGLGRIDLRADLAGAKLATVERVVAERLQPWPKPHTRQAGALHGALQRVVHDVPGCRDGVGMLRDSEGETGRIEHRRDVVEALGERLQLLPDLGVVLVPADVAEHVGGDEHVVRRQP